MDKSILKELAKKHFNLTDKIEVTTQKFDEAVLVDGTKVTNQSEEAFAEGQTLYVVTEEDGVLVAPEGAHVTESGIELVVDGQGVITQVNRPDESEMEEESTEDVEMASEEESMEEEIIEEVEMEDDVKEAIIEAIAEAVLPEIEALKTKMSEMEEKMAEHAEKMKEYMSSSATSPTTEKKFSKSKLNKSIKPAAPVYNTKRYEQMLNKVTKK